MVSETTLESPSDCGEIQPVHTKGDQSWVFIGRTDVEAETPILLPPDVKNWLKNWLIWKDPDAGKDRGQEEKGMTEDEMVGWHHRLNGHGFGCTPGVGDGQGGLACCSLWGLKELNTTERLNWTECIHQERNLMHIILSKGTFSLKLSQLHDTIYSIFYPVLNCDTSYRFYFNISKKWILYIYIISYQWVTQGH